MRLLGCGKDRIGLGEHVEHRELFLGELLADVPLLLFAQFVGELAELGEELLDVLRSGVVALDQVAELVGVVDPLRVQSDHPLQPLLERCLQPGDSGGLAALANSAASASKSIW